MFATRHTLVLLVLALLSGCELLGLDSPEKLAALKEGDAKAVGSACRHASRALEDCYALNPKAQKAAVFAGWREMDEYMREHKLDSVAPALAHATVGSTAEARPGADRKPAATAGRKAEPDS